MSPARNCWWTAAWPKAENPNSPPVNRRGKKFVSPNIQTVEGNALRKENMSILNLNQDSFDAAINSNTEPVLVDFWAEWCGPCKMIAPVLKEIATEQTGKAVIAKVNIDESPELAVRFGITGIPTLIVFKNGKPTTTLRGVQSKSVMVKALTAAA